MEEEDDAAANTAVFPVFLFNGDRKWHAGNIKIHQDLVFEEFQMMLTQMIGISSDNLTTYLVDNRKSKISPERWKIPVTGNFNFALIVIRPMNCHFMVVLKQSRRRDRNQSDDLSRVHLNQLDMNQSQMSGCSLYHYNDRFQDLLLQTDNYLNMISNSRYGCDFPLSLNFPIESRSDRTLCEDCTEAQKQGKTAEFHLCVYDEVVLDFFRSPAGPISCRR